MARVLAVQNSNIVVIKCKILQKWDAEALALATASGYRANVMMRLRYTTKIVYTRIADEK